MRIVFDSKELSNKMKEKATAARENAGKLTDSLKSKKEAASLSTLRDDLEYLQLIAEWNADRLESGRPAYVPSGMHKDTESILHQTVKEILNERAKARLK